MDFKHVAVLGKSDESISKVKKELARFGFIYSETEPDFVISYGGDGMALMAERAFPSVPKVLIRDSKICNKCHDLPLDHILEKISEGQFSLSEEIKLEATVNNNEKKIAANDFCLRNELPTHALRFELFVDGKEHGGEIIGDGIIISTSFGAGAYFHSVTRKTFTEGIGIGFNNPTKAKEPLIVKDTSEIKLKITRGHAVFVADNDPAILKLTEGDSIIIQKGREVFRLIQVS